LSTAAAFDKVSDKDPDEVRSLDTPQVFDNLVEALEDIGLIISL